MDEDDLAILWVAASMGDHSARRRVAGGLATYLAEVLQTWPFRQTDPARGDLLAQVLLHLLRKIDSRETVADPKGYTTCVAQIALADWREDEQPPCEAAQPLSYASEMAPESERLSQREIGERLEGLGRSGEEIVNLLAALLLEDWASAKELYDRVRLSLTRWLERSFRVASHEAGVIASDVISELFIQCCNLKDPERAGSYARTILFRFVRDLREARRRGRPGANVSDTIPDRRLTASVEEIFSAEDLFWRLIHILDPAARVIFILRHAGVANGEIADSLKMSLRTLERMVTQIRRKANTLIHPD